MPNSFKEENLTQLAVDELIRLSETIEQLIATKLREEKRALYQKLSTIEKYERGSTTRRREPDRVLGKGRKLRRSKAVPKYRDPESGATWSGRGVLPRWLTQAIANGGTREQFRISSAGNGFNGGHSI